VQEDEGKLAPVEEGMSAQQQLEEIEELARRAIACKRWRWMPGMLTEKGLRVIQRDRDGNVVWYYQDKWYIAELVPGTRPDLTDPATLGCLLALVREAWGNEASVSLNISSFWAVGGAKIQKGKSAGHTINLGIWKLTEVEALVAALEAAP
jgi:hypothetical protein